MNLLSKTRRINRLLQKAAGHAVNFMEMAEVLRDVIDANVYVVSRKGKVLGFATNSPVNTPFQQAIAQDRRFPDEYNSFFMKVDETSANLSLNDLPSMFVDQIQEFLQNRFVTIVPLIGAGDRLGTLVLTRDENQFVDDDLILAEYGATVVAMEILREKGEQIEQEARNKAVVSMAIGSLSYSELEAVEHIFEELKGTEGLLIASKIADRVGITRSVIVNALRKLESAGVIESRSLGMKGTFIKVLNERLVTELEKIKS